MKIVEWILTGLIWIAGAIGLVFVGWILKSYQVGRNKVVKG